MIFDGIIWLVSRLFTALLGSLPKFDVPSWLLKPADPVVLIFSEASSMAVWINLPLALIVGTIVFTSMWIGGATRLARIILSVFTGGGGAGA